MNSKYRDIIDAEYFFHLDRQKESEELHIRDRNIFLQGGNLLGENSNASLLISMWINNQRRAYFNETDSLGTIVGKSLLTTKIVLFTLTFFLGISGSTAYLSYSGNTPINIFAFLLIFIGTQFFFIAITTILQILAHFSYRQDAKTTSLLTRYIFQKTTSFFTRSLLPHLSAEHRLIFTHNLGSIQQKRGYVLHISRLLNSVHQSAAISFNIGLILGSLFKITTADIAFGWQSTLQLSDTWVFTMVTALSTPWRWSSHLAATTPTLEEIAGSHIVLKEGIYHLSNQNLSSWWPFLVLCLFTYGLIPRVALYCYARFLETLFLHKSPYQTADYQKLLHRMRTPIFEQKTAPNLSTHQSQTDEQEVVTDTRASEQKTPRNQQKSIHSHAVLLLPSDLSNTDIQQKIPTWLGQHGYKINSCFTFMKNYEEDQRLADQLSQFSWKEDSAILIVIEAHMVPLTELFSYLQLLRTRTHTLIEVILIGKEKDGLLASPKESEIALWRRKITGLGDSFITTFPVTFPRETT